MFIFMLRRKQMFMPVCLEVILDNSLKWDNYSNNFNSIIDREMEYLRNCLKFLKLLQNVQHFSTNF